MLPLSDALRRPTHRNSRSKELHRIVKTHRIFRDDLRYARE